MPKRFCIDCGHLYDRDDTGTQRCPEHQAAADRRRNARPNTTARGYGSTHQRERERQLQAFEPGQPCARCGQPIESKDDAQLGHDDNDRSIYRGLEHIACNEGAPGRRRRQ